MSIDYANFDAHQNHARHRDLDPSSNGIVFNRCVLEDITRWVSNICEVIMQSTNLYEGHRDCIRSGFNFVTVGRTYVTT